MKKTAGLLAAISLILVISMFFTGCSCSGTVDPTDPENTSDPSAMITDNPGGTDAASDPTKAPSSDPAGTADPAAFDPNNSGDPANTNDPAVNTPAPGDTAAPAQNTPIPTMPPTDEPLTGTVWLECPCSVLYDLDLDGRPEKIELGMSGRDLTVSVTTGSGNMTYSERVTADSFLSAVVSDFNKEDGRAELVVSTLNGRRGHKLLALRLNKSSDGLDSCSADGWIESIDEGSIVIGRKIDIMGTWDCAAAFELSKNSFEFVMTDELWTVKRPEERWCTVSQDMLVGLYTTGPDNETTFLEPGYRMYPTSTDLSGIINVTLDTGAHGYLSVTFGQNGRPMYSGLDLTEWFSDLTFDE